MRFLTHTGLGAALLTVGGLFFFPPISAAQQIGSYGNTLTPQESSDVWQPTPPVDSGPPLDGMPCISNSPCSGDNSCGWVRDCFLQPANYRTAPGFELPWFHEAPDGPIISPTCAPACSDGWRYDYHALARGYYINDQRIEWTGQEATFAAEGVLAGAVRRCDDGVQWGGLGEIFLTQPFDENILVDDAIRVAYRNNFVFDPVEISQLFLEFRYGPWMAAVGKFITPFGRTYFPLYLNDLSDAPFIRSEAILWRETGLLLQFLSNGFTVSAALTNGSVDRDTNSSKALVARVGYDGQWFGGGLSVKQQDGIGSEGQKTFNNHAGADLMLRGRRWSLSGEAIYDEYGIRRPGFDLNNITWGRSLYFRELNNGYQIPISGVGYYVNFNFRGDNWLAVFNYGEFYPEPIGHPLHDATNRRGIVKYVYSASAHLDIYFSYLRENDALQGQGGRIRRGESYFVGVQASL